MEWISVMLLALSYEGFSCFPLRLQKVQAKSYVQLFLVHYGRTCLFSQILKKKCEKEEITFWLNLIKLNQLKPFVW